MSPEKKGKHIRETHQLCIVDYLMIFHPIWQFNLNKNMKLENSAYYIHSQTCCITTLPSNVSLIRGLPACVLTGLRFFARGSIAAKSKSGAGTPCTSLEALIWDWSVSIATRYSCSEGLLKNCNWSWTFQLRLSLHHLFHYLQPLSRILHDSNHFHGWFSVPTSVQ